MARCDSYAWGNCTWGACEAAGWVPEGWGNAKDWAYHAMQDGFGVVFEATVGAVVVYGDNPAYSSFGHVAVVTAVYGDGSFEVREMNAVGLGVWDDRHSNMFDVEGFILPPGVQVGAGGPPVGDGAGADYSALAAAWAQFADVFNQWLPQWAQQSATLAGYLRTLVGG